MDFPPRVERVKTPLGESRMVEHDLRLRAVFEKLKSHERIHTRRPIRGPPCLDNALVGNELYISSADHSSEHREGATDSAVNLRRRTRKGSEPLGIQQCFVDLLRSRLEIGNLMQGRAPAARLCGGLLRLALSASCFCAQSADRERSPHDKPAPSVYIDQPGRLTFLIHHGVDAF